MTGATTQDNGHTAFDDLKLVIAHTIVEELRFQNPDLREIDNGAGECWLSGGTTPQSAGCTINIFDIASAVEREVLSATAAPALLEALEAERDAAIREMSAWAREAGEAKGRLEASEMAGVVEGWKERAEAAEARLQMAVEALQALRDSCRRHLVGVGDGETFTVSAPSMDALMKADDALQAIRGRE